MEKISDCPPRNPAGYGQYRHLTGSIRHPPFETEKGFAGVQDPNRQLSGREKKTTKKNGKYGPRNKGSKKLFRICIVGPETRNAQRSEKTSSSRRRKNTRPYVTGLGMGTGEAGEEMSRGSAEGPGLGAENRFASVTTKGRTTKGEKGGEGMQTDTAIGYRKTSFTHHIPTPKPRRKLLRRRKIHDASSRNKKGHSLENGRALVEKRRRPLWKLSRQVRDRGR